MCFETMESERYVRWNPPSRGGISNIAPLSKRLWRLVKRIFPPIDLHRKREEGLDHLRKKPWAADANANDTTRPAGAEDRHSIQVNVVNHLFLAQFNFPGMDLTTLAVYGTKGIVLDTKKLDMKKLGKPREALSSHPPFAIRRPQPESKNRRKYNVTRPDPDATPTEHGQKLVMRRVQGQSRQRRRAV
ncbi:hypothetical protein M441DRAFT_47697 [Trichoderma asperellum CBS 433.97]|uniref:Uncharacterized protein n=1 Tax=Trichoderma asperellum (strain ATCC 204424 / CBS 433.97 / NBRC 101777) TaxID=1042311 RepID=A0A2T3Z4T5_TRIA4|nr:hypothetical protein M441DRAFT_47697 [Trichoderma asperellum CBS 433.97]PTB39797.1 hypothetical protein M441DRAFT_47697 [Trichoderma asperellum CBS 433.97]